MLMKSLYNSSQGLIQEINNSGTITKTLTKKQSYYIRVASQNSNDVGSYTVILKGTDGVFSKDQL